MEKTRGKKLNLELEQWKLLNLENKENGLKKMNRALGHLEDSNKRSNSCAIDVPEGEERNVGAENVLKE